MRIRYRVNKMMNQNEGLTMPEDSKDEETMVRQRHTHRQKDRMVVERKEDMVKILQSILQNQ
jgi:hypothetical protein